MYVFWDTLHLKGSLRDIIGEKVFVLGQSSAKLSNENYYVKNSRSEKPKILTKTEIFKTKIKNFCRGFISKS